MKAFLKDPAKKNKDAVNFHIYSCKRFETQKIKQFFKSRESTTAKNPLGKDDL